MQFPIQFQKKNATRAFASRDFALGRCTAVTSHGKVNVGSFLPHFSHPKCSLPSYEGGFEGITPLGGTAAQPQHDERP